MSASSEWRSHWTLPVAAMVGFSTLGLQSLGIGPFVTHLEAEFGWTRSQVMIGLSLSNAVGIFLNVIVGMFVDRIGPRRVALTGLVVKTVAFAALGTATASLFHWAFLWLGVAIGVVLTMATVWTSAIATRFDSSRGFAFAVCLTGTSVTAAVAPVLATWLITEFGWRLAFAGVGAIWLLVTFPVVFLFFRGARDGRSKASDAEPEPHAEPVGLTLREGIRTATFLRLIASFGTFSFYSMAISSNLVPLLMETGAGTMEAAQIAAVMGLVGIVARLSIGFLLDRFRANVIGAIAQFLPVIGCAVLLADMPGTWPLIFAVATFGIATGAEMDVTIYLATRHFGLKAFAALFGAVIGVGAVMAAIAPLAAGAMHDLTGNYDSMLLSIMAVMALGAIAIASTGRAPAAFAEARS